MKKILSFRFFLGLSKTISNKMLRQNDYADVNGQVQHKFLRIFTFSTFCLIGTLFFGCGESSGLGKAVDLVSPRISITSHVGTETVPSEFTLSGTVWDNEEVKIFTIDCEDANLHYKITPDASWYKKTASTGDEWIEVSDTQGSCTVQGQTWIWSILIDTKESSETWTDTTYEFKAIVEDAIGNTGTLSSVDFSLTIDTEDPDVSIYKPDLFKTTYSDANSKCSTYALKDGNTIARLLNGDISLAGRQSGSISFKELLIEFDDGSASQLDANTYMQTNLTNYPTLTSPTAQEVSETVKLGGEEKPTVYYSHLIEGDLRSWDFTVCASDWVNDEKNPSLKTGKHLIRVVASSVSESNAWEKKILGYFVWWPEADEPWITTYAGDDTYMGDSAYEVYPSSNFSGTAQDDDGIKSLSYVLMKKDNDTYTNYSSETLPLSEEGAKYAAFAVPTPSENGNYKLTISVVDLYGTSSSLTKYFKTLDVSPPKIEVSEPESGSSVLANADGTVKFSGNVSDDGTINSFCVAFLNPAKTNDASNKIAYMSGNSTSAPWSSVSSETTSYTDENGNIIYWISLDTPQLKNNRNVYTFEKTLNLFDDLGIDGANKTLEALDFVFRAEDSGQTSSVLVFSLAGDTENPSLELNTLVLKDSSDSQVQSYTFNDDETPTLPVIKSGYTAELSGTWSDNSTTTWVDSYKLKICDLDLTWNEKAISATLKSDGTWTASVPSASLPTTSGVIKAVLKDYGANTKTVTRSVFIESAEAGLESIGCENDDGSYKTGTEIKITLEFTKATDVSGSPTLTLNNDKTATYSSGSGTSKHIYTYTVETGDDVESLDVIAINTNGATWTDSATGTTLDVENPAENKRIGATRNIKIDTKLPKLKSITAISGEGSYKKDSQILLMLTFNESVTITSGENLSLGFTHSASTTSATVSGSNVIFTYTVGEGENTVELKLSSISYAGVTIVDEAGNKLSDWNLPNTTLSNKIIVDTTAPAAPTITPDWGDSKIVFDTNGTSFTISGESGATIEYTIDGSSFQTYNGEVSLLNNGTYTVSARQTDEAGNVSSESTPITVTVDKGELLTKITASTVSGTYSTKTTTTSISGKIIFRKAVTIPSGAKVTLNVKNGSSTSKTVSINEAGSAASEYTFTYTITEGDYIDGNDLLDVIDWSFNTVSVTYDTGTVTSDISLPEAGDSTGKAFADNREIYILTGVPTVQSAVLSGEGSDAVLTVTFDRDISKVSGNITFTQDEDTYRVPSVLSVSEYNELKSQISNYYTKGMNGATESGSYLTNDTTTKYVLNYEYENDNSTITGIFKTAKKHVVSIPIVASAVAASGKVLTVTLGSTYELPTKGATYTLSIPADAVTDEAQNKNTVYSTSLTAEGVESPVIRINKTSQTITPGPSPNYTAASSVSQPEKASVKIDCKTPETTIYYAYNTQNSETVHVNKSPLYFETKTTDATVPTSLTNTYSSAFTLGDSISDYDSATGKKFAIAAYAKKGDLSSATSYEYATRTVLKLTITGNSDTTNATSKVKENGSYLSFKDLKVWVFGGDSPYGGNTLDPFPLSWSDPANFKLMSGSWNNTGICYGNWYWVSWDITTSTYHGFVLGDVPSDAATNGPTYWYAAECAWVAQKENYVLYPGETLEMAVETTNEAYYQAKFMFRIKNEGTRVE